MLPLLLLPFLSLPPAPPADGPFAALTIYNGTWSVKALHAFSGGTGPDTLENHCTAGQAFYTCEQIVNGSPAALVIFVVAKEPGKFDVDNVLPNGHALSNTDLFVKGDHWTYLTHASAPGQPQYRTENVFHGADSIHFEQFQSTDDGKTWTKTNEGEETRQNPA